MPPGSPRQIPVGHPGPRDRGRGSTAQLSRERDLPGEAASIDREAPFASFGLGTVEATRLDRRLGIVARPPAFADAA